MKKSFLSLIFTIFLQWDVMSYDPPAGYSVNLSYPVNHLNASKPIAVNVEVPATYRALGPVDGPFVEFVPAIDTDPNQWSELWTMVVSVGGGHEAKEMMDQTVGGIQNHPGADLKVISREDEDKRDYYQSTAYIQYKDPSSKTGKAIAEYIVLAGPADAVMLQRVKAYAQDSEVEGILDTFKKEQHFTMIEGG